MAEIVYDDVTVTFNGSHVAGISFHIPEAAHACFLGPIGSGKSHVLKSLSARSRLTKGSAHHSCDGSKLDSYGFYRLTQLIEFSNPSRYFNPAHHFYQQRYHHQMEDDEFSKSVTISGLLNEKGISLTDQDVLHSLSRANLHDHLETKLIQLSNGQRKKLQLILALMKRSPILLLDSPHLGLDDDSRDDLNDWLNEVAKQNAVQIIMCTDERDIPEWITCRIDLPGDRKPPNDFQLLDWIKPGQPGTATSTAKKVFEFDNLNLSLGSKHIFKNLSWRIHPGERVALIGKNGSGKSTMMSFLYADNPRAYSTMLRMFGVQRGKGDTIWDVKRKIGFVSSELHIYFTESISCKKVIATGFFDTKFVPRNLSAKEEETLQIFAQSCNVESLLERNFQHISYGEQRLILLIRALVKIPQLLLLDEPYQGFDLSLIRQSNALIDFMVKRFGITLLFISHYEDELPECIERKLLLEDGKLVEV